MTDDNSSVLPQLQTNVLVSEHVLMRQVGEEVVILDLKKESYYGLNSVGARLMQLAETGATLEQIVERMLTEFEVGREQLEVDVRKLAAELIAAGLIAQGGIR